MQFSDRGGSENAVCASPNRYARENSRCPSLCLFPIDDVHAFVGHKAAFEEGPLKIPFYHYQTNNTNSDTSRGRRRTQLGFLLELRLLSPVCIIPVYPDLWARKKAECKKVKNVKLISLCHYRKLKNAKLTLSQL